MAEPHRIAVIAGDGVGPEVVGSACRVHAALRPQDELLQLEAGFGTFEATGIALPEESFEVASSCDAILFGAVGSPAGRVDSGANHGYRSPILELRRRLGLYANLRPVSSSPIDSSRQGVDLLIVRENTEGLYAGRERIEDDGETAIAERVITRAASRRITERAVSAALERAAALERPALLTIVHKANVLRLSDGLFRETALEVAAGHPQLEVEEQLVDSMAHRLFLEPERYDVIVAPNLYGDILSDAAAALVGGLGLVASANLGDKHLLVEPVHGSAPDIAGQGIANPIATLRALGLLLHELGDTRASRSLEEAIEAVLRNGPHTPDLGGAATTEQVTDAVLETLQPTSPIPQDLP
jgi:homoisocitrate dehydrogenase